MAKKVTHLRGAIDVSVEVAQMESGSAILTIRDLSNALKSEGLIASLSSLQRLKSFGFFDLGSNPLDPNEFERIKKVIEVKNRLHKKATLPQLAFFCAGLAIEKIPAELVAEYLEAELATIHSIKNREFSRQARGTAIARKYPNADAPMRMAALYIRKLIRDASLSTIDMAFFYDGLIYLFSAFFAITAFSALPSTQTANLRKGLYALSPDTKFVDDHFHSIDEAFRECMIFLSPEHGPKAATSLVREALANAPETLSQSVRVMFLCIKFITETLVNVPTIDISGTPARLKLLDRIQSRFPNMIALFILMLSKKQKLATFLTTIPLWEIPHFKIEIEDFFNSKGAIFHGAR